MDVRAPSPPQRRQRPSYAAAAVEAAYAVPESGIYRAYYTDDAKYDPRPRSPTSAAVSSSSSSARRRPAAAAAADANGANVIGVEESLLRASPARQQQVPASPEQDDKENEKDEIEPAAPQSLLLDQPIFNSIYGGSTKNDPPHRYFEVEETDGNGRHKRVYFNRRMDVHWAPVAREIIMEKRRAERDARLALQNAPATAAMAATADDSETKSQTSFPAGSPSKSPSPRSGHQAPQAPSLTSLSPAVQQQSKTGRRRKHTEAGLASIDAKAAELLRSKRHRPSHIEERVRAHARLEAGLGAPAASAASLPTENKEPSAATAAASDAVDMDIDRPISAEELAETIAKLREEREGMRSQKQVVDVWNKKEMLRKHAFEEMEMKRMREAEDSLTEEESEARARREKEFRSVPFLGPATALAERMRSSADDTLRQKYSELQRSALYGPNNSTKSASAAASAPPVNEGDRLYQTLWDNLALIARANELTYSSMQLRFLTEFARACAPLVYGKHWNGAVASAFLAREKLLEHNAFVLAMTPRRFGKTTAVTAFLLALAMTVPDLKILVYSQNKRTSEHLIAKVMQFAAGLESRLPDKRWAHRIIMTRRDAVTVVPLQIPIPLKPGKKALQTAEYHGSSIRALPCTVDGTHASFTTVCVRGVCGCVHTGTPSLLFLSRSVSLSPWETKQSKQVCAGADRRALNTAIAVAARACVCLFIRRRDRQTAPWSTYARYWLRQQPQQGRGGDAAAVLPRQQQKRQRRFHSTCC